MKDVMPKMSEELRAVIQPSIDIFTEQVLKRCRGTYGQLSPREENMVRRVSFTLISAMIETHRMMGESLKTVPSLVEHWDKMDKIKFDEGEDWLDGLRQIKI